MFAKARISTLLSLAVTTLALGGWLIAAPAFAGTYTQNASGWSVNNNADWTPSPPSTNPLGGPNDLCTGASTPTGSWAEFTFPGFGIPAGETVTGIEVRVNYRASTDNTVQLTNGGSLVGTAKTDLPDAFIGASFCSSTFYVGTGGSGDLWGTSLTTADFNAGNVGFRITQNAPTVDIDAVELIAYTGVEADLGVTKSDGLTVVNQGASLTYTITVTNHGPDDVTGATVTDTFPADLTCTWTCAASAGSSCTAGPVAGDLSDTVDLLNGGTATYSAVCDVAANASGTLSNTASVAVPSGVTDPVPGNDSATDNDTAVNEAPVAQCQDVNVDANGRGQRFVRSQRRPHHVGAGTAETLQSG